MLKREVFQTLKMEVFKKYHMYTSVNILRAKYTAFEFTVRDVGVDGKFYHQYQPAQVAMATDDAEEEQPAVATMRQHSHTTPTKPCGSCGGSLVDKGMCPARGITCHGYQKMGHFRKYNRNRKKVSYTKVSGAVMIALMASPHQSLLAVSVSLPHGGQLFPQ